MDSLAAERIRAVATAPPLQRRTTAAPLTSKLEIADSTDQRRPRHGYRIRDVDARSGSMLHLTQRTYAMVL